MGKFTRSFSVSLGLVLALGSSLAEAAPYCLALRGNGELQPAHWGALARVVEERGLPRMQAGGSSAVLSMMLLDALAENRWVGQGEEAEQRLRAAYLLKTLHGLSLMLLNSEDGKATLHLIATLREAKSLSGSEQIQLLEKVLSGEEPLSPDQLRQIGQLVSRLQDLGIGDSPDYALVLKALVDLRTGQSLPEPERARAAFYARDLILALKTLGAFDARSDQDLFFRRGIINFSRFGGKIGVVARFLSQASAASECVEISKSRIWPEIVRERPTCLAELKQAWINFVRSRDSDLQQSFALRPLGSNIPTLATTAVLRGKAFQSARVAMENYHQGLSKYLARAYRVESLSDVGLGYFGRIEDLELIEQQLPKVSEDPKSKMFLPLGTANWLEALRLSPAEPGLASLQEMNVQGEPAYSAGGWSDLHPTIVLKAAGCESVIYVTRRGGESIFAQGVAKRLLNFERSWERLADRDLNNLGDASDLTSLWSRLYNLANPASAISRSLEIADEVLCTNWNSFSVSEQLNELVVDAYRAPLLSRADRAKLSRPLWAGCQ